MFVTRPSSEVALVWSLFERGQTNAEISALTHVPPSTVSSWLKHVLPPRGSRAPAPDLDALPAVEYAYLLGFYLGDGYMSAQVNGSWLLRVISDSAYPAVLNEAHRAMEAVSHGRAWQRKRNGCNAIEVGLTWWHWLTVLPQHGPGRKHTRPIVLEPWQWAIVAKQPEMFLRGLIHSDGWRGLNRVTVKGRNYAYPRYQFSNRSSDIRKLFTDACDLIAIDWRPWGRWHISVARRASVVRMDEFIGPKE